MSTPFSRRQALAVPLAVLATGAAAQGASAATPAPSAPAPTTPPAAAPAPATRAPAFNNNPLIRRQTSGGQPQRRGTVTIDYYGHDAFLITSPQGTTVLLDPWRNDASGQFAPWFAREFPTIPVDLVISTHAHFDHDAVDRPQARMVMLRPVGRYQLGDVRVDGLADKHVCRAEGRVNWTDELLALGVRLCPPDNDLPFDNVIPVITTGGLRIATWGDNRPVPSPALDAQLRDLDVLILPVDGSEHILTYEGADAIIKKYAPKIVVPGHYANAGLTLPASTLDSADGWVARQRNVSRVSTGRVVLDAQRLKGRQTRIVHFGSGLAKAARR